MTVNRWIAATVLTCLLWPALGWAEQKVTFRGYELHYIVINTTELTPEIASRYGVNRSGTLALLNLSVLEQQDDGVPTPVEAEVTARKRNLLGQSEAVPLRVVQEQNAIYHLGEVRFDDRDTLWFDITVEIPGEPAFEHSFSQQLWEESE